MEQWSDSHSSSTTSNGASEAGPINPLYMDSMQSIKEQMRFLRAEREQATDVAVQRDEDAGDEQADARSAPRSFATAQSSGMHSAYSMSDAEDAPWDEDREGEWYEEEDSYAAGVPSAPRRGA